MEGIFLLLGSNEGNRIQWIQKATEELKQLKIYPVRYSSVWETKAWGIKDQPDFLNVVIEIITEDSVYEILEKILSIESSLGRIRKEKWGPRIIDIDILYFKNEIIDDPHLKVPHPEIINRKFTLLPLAELVPNDTDPRHNKKLAELLNLCTDPLPCRVSNLSFVI